jgi:cell division protein FtsB
MAVDLERKTAELANEQLLRKQREREKFLLENDPEYIETIARDRLDLMKEGETIFRLDGPTAQPVPDAAPVPPASNSR